MYHSTYLRLCRDRSRWHRDAKSCKLQKNQKRDPDRQTGTRAMRHAKTQFFKNVHAPHTFMSPGALTHGSHRHLRSSFDSFDILRSRRETVDKDDTSSGSIGYHLVENPRAPEDAMKSSSTLTHTPVYHCTSIGPTKHVSKRHYLNITR